MPAVVLVCRAVVRDPSFTGSSHDMKSYFIIILLYPFVYLKIVTQMIQLTINFSEYIVRVDIIIINRWTAPSCMPRRGQGEKECAARRGAASHQHRK